MMFGQVQKQVPTDRISCRFPLKWENCDGIRLAIGEQSVGFTIVVLTDAEL